LLRHSLLFLLQLAQLINEKPQIINEYENGKAIPNPQVGASSLCLALKHAFFCSPRSGRYCSEEGRGCRVSHQLQGSGSAQEREGAAHLFTNWPDRRASLGESGACEHAFWVLLQTDPQSAMQCCGPCS
jgi:hypothetical protein